MWLSDVPDTGFAMFPQLKKNSHHTEENAGKSDTASW